jgi:hypothetical protein
VGQLSLPGTAIHADRRASTRAVRWCGRSHRSPDSIRLDSWSVPVAAARGGFGHQRA